MELTFNKQTALAILRLMRADGYRFSSFADRSDLRSPSPAPQKRWTNKLFKQLFTNLENCHFHSGYTSRGLQPPANGAPSRYSFLQGEDAITVAVPSEASRIRASGVECSIYGREVPASSFVDLGCGVAISCPELLFAELACSLRPIEAVMLGHELCGAFCRDARDPYNGPVTYGVEPATSVEAIRAFLDNAKHIRGIRAARSLVSYVNDNAWSPTESLVAALLVLPVDDFGFDLGPLVLNPRYRKARDLPGAKESRVPDILIADSLVGVNYDGLAHLDLGAVAKAAFEAGAHPETSQAQRILERTIANVRGKALDDIRRNRELAAHGLMVYPILKEDLYVPGGIDQVVEQLIGSLEQTESRDCGQQKRILKEKALSRVRHRVILSLLPGGQERNVQVGMFIEGHEVSNGPCEVTECWIEF